MRSKFICFVGASVFVFVSALANAPAANSGVADLGSRYVEVFRRPEFEQSRCVLSPIFMSNNRTVALSTDRVFATGDTVLSVAGETLDADAKLPLVDLLKKHSATETLPLNIRRAGKETAIAAKCSDSKPYFDLLLEAAYAASKNDAAACADKMNRARTLRGASPWLMIEFSYKCNLQAGRIAQIDQARGFYEIYREMILEASWSTDALGRIRGSLLTAVDILRKHNQQLLGDDLKQQFDDAVTASANAPALSARAN